MHARFEERIEEGLKTIAASAKKRQTVAKIAERVGRLLGKNTAPQGFSKFKCVRVGRGARITWEKVETWRAWAQLSEGAYVLRSNVSDWTHEEIWHAYIQLTWRRRRSAFRKLICRFVLSGTRKKIASLAHILVCFLAYVLWKLLGQSCAKAGLGDEPVGKCAGRTR